MNNGNLNYLLQESHFYSESHKKLIGAMAENEQMRQYQLDSTKDGVVKIIREWKYDYGAWPLIISSDLKNKFESFINQMPNIFYKAIHSMFDNGDDFASYLNESPIVFDMLRSTKIDYKNMLLRYDLVFSNNLFKVIEINAGTNLGGWELGWLTTLFYDAFTEFEETKNWNLVHKHTIEIVFRELIDNVRRLPNRNGDKNLLFYMTDPIFLETRGPETFYELFEKVKREKIYKGNLYWTTQTEDILVNRAGDVSFKGLPLEAFVFNIESSENISTQKLLQLMNSFTIGKLVFPDCPLLTIVGNKLMLALLYDAKNAGNFDSQEIELIERHIPWTAKSNKQSIIWHGQEYTGKDLLKAHQSSFVLKKSQSMQGKDVFIGATTDQKKWEMVVEKFADDNDWIIQEFQKPDYVACCEQDGHLGLYNIVWGVFDVAAKYGGSFIRANKVEHDNSVINCARGAVLFTIFEEAERKNKICI